MRWFGTTLVVAALLGVAGRCGADDTLIPYDPTTMSYPVSPDQAAANARQWAGNSSLSLQLAGIKRISEFQRDYYRLDTPDPQRFYVNCYTGQLWRWKSEPAAGAYDADTQQNASSPLPVLPLADQEQAATAFARAHFPGFDALNMQVADAVNGHVYFEAGVPGGGFFHGNGCWVHLDEFSGAVYECYECVTGPVTISTQPQLSAAQAENVAFSTYAGNPSVASAFTYQPSRLDVGVDALGQQRLEWTVFTAVSDWPNLTLQQWTDAMYLNGDGVRIEVDAITGQVIYSDMTQGRPGGRVVRVPSWRPRVRHYARRAYRGGLDLVALLDPPRPAVLVDTRSTELLCYAPLKRGAGVHWAAVYLRSPLWGMTVSRRGRTLVVSDRPGRRAVLRDGSRHAIIGGRSVRLIQAPFVRHGRTYLPLDAWEKITGSRFEWSAEKNALLIRLAPAGAAAAPHHQGAAGGSTLAAR